jgi:ABC-type multidrug transport system ATPase subunit
MWKASEQRLSVSPINAGALTARDLATGYRSRGNPEVITRANFVIEQGTVAAVIGANGSGKTTLLKTMVGLLPPLEGTITLGQSTVAEHRLLHGIGYLPEALAFHRTWTVGDLLELTAFSARAGYQEIMDACRFAEVDFDMQQPVEKLSKGMRQRLGLAMALLPVPALLLLDEPEAGLDPGQRIRLRDRMRELAAKGCIIVIASHDVSGICSVADLKFLLAGGEMKLVGDAELSDPARLVQLFAGGAQ